MRKKTRRDRFPGLNICNSTEVGMESPAHAKKRVQMSDKGCLDA